MEEIGDDARTTTTNNTVTQRIPPIGIDVRSIGRFIRQFDVATNIVSRTDNQTRLTFVLMFALPPNRDVATLYAIRYYTGAEADDVSSILDHVYRVREDLDESSIVQTQIQQQLIDRWLAEFPNAKFLPRFPHVYSFFFDPEAYREPDIEKKIMEYRSAPYARRDLLRSTRSNNNNNNNNEEEEQLAMTATDYLLDDVEDASSGSVVEPMFKDALDVQQSDDELKNAATVASTPEESSLHTSNRMLARLLNDSANVVTRGSSSSSSNDTSLDDENRRCDMWCKGTPPPVRPALVTSNVVDANGFTDWLQTTTSDRTSLDAWIEAHHRVDQVLFNRDRLHKMFRNLAESRACMVTGLPVIARNWTLPFLRFVLSRKLNDIFAFKVPKLLMYTHVNFDEGLDREHIRRRGFAVSADQCRSRRGFNIVLPSEWIESSILDWNELFFRFCRHLARPDDQFLRLRLYSESHPSSTRSNVEYFWSKARRLDSSSSSGRKQHDNEDRQHQETLSRNQDMINRLFNITTSQKDTDFRLMPPPPPPLPRSTSQQAAKTLFSALLPPPPPPCPPTPEQSTTTMADKPKLLPNSQSTPIINRQYVFCVGDEVYGEKTETENEIACRRIRFVSSFRSVPMRRLKRSTRIMEDVSVADIDYAPLTKPATPIKKVTAIDHLGMMFPGSLNKLQKQQLQPSPPPTPSAGQQQQQQQQQSPSIDVSSLVCQTYDHWEQSLLLMFSLYFLDPDHSINVNGDPGTGKSTTLWFMMQLFARPLCAVPTNKMKHQFAEKLFRLSQAKFLNYSAASVQTLSACIKRLGCFKISPQSYSRILVKCFPDCVNRLSRLMTNKNSCYNVELYNTGLGWFGPAASGCKTANRDMAEYVARSSTRNDTATTTTTTANPNDVLAAAAKRCLFIGPNVDPPPLSIDSFAAPDVIMMDESNMCTWQHAAFLVHGLRRLRCSLIAFGDSGQNRPINADPDNSDLIAFSSGGLTVQLLTNKRLCSNSNEDSPIARVLDDNVWRLVVSDNNVTVNEAIGNYVRTLLNTNFSPAGIIEQWRLDVSEDVERWCTGIEALHAWYKTHPCHRYAFTIRQATEIADQIPQPKQWFLISQTNVSCDRFNHWYLTAFHRQLMKRVFTATHPDKVMFMLYSLGIVRQCYIPRGQLPVLNSNHVTYDDKSYDPLTDPAFLVPIKQLDKEDFMLNIRGNILDDTWASQLRLCVGFTYMYLGNASCIPPSGLLRLIAILPDITKNHAFLCLSVDCEHCMHIRKQDDDMRLSSALSVKRTTPDVDSVSGLLMQLVCRPSSGASNTSSSRNNKSSNNDKFVIVTQEYYRVSRYNSFWCDSKYRPSQRGNSCFYGYPLRLHSSLTSYKVQGETLYRELYPAVCVDLGNMSRESALVSLSRVTDNAQLRSILNLDTCCPAWSASTPFGNNANNNSNHKNIPPWFMKRAGGGGGGDNSGSGRKKKKRRTN